MLRKFSHLLILCFLVSCSKELKPSESNSFNGLALIDFCDLPKYEGQLVYVKAVYSGVEEYWGLRPLHRCDSAFSVELDDLAGNPIPHKFKNAFQSVHTSYWNSYLVIEATGIYESKSTEGYGHLGSNTARLIVKDYVSVTVVKKTKSKG